MLNLHHLIKLTWLEVKIFLREPMGAIGTVLVPVILFLVLGRLNRGNATLTDQSAGAFTLELPVVLCLLVAISGVTSLIAIISIYREGGILKRLRATPLSPITILSAHVLAKMLFTALTLMLLALVGRRFYLGQPPSDLLGFLLAVIFVTVCILSIGFVLASVVPTARFAQPLASIVLYPLFTISGAFFPLEALPGPWPDIARLSPLTHAVDLLRATWHGAGWGGQGVAVGVLSLTFAISVSLAARMFRWE